MAGVMASRMVLPIAVRCDAEDTQWHERRLVAPTHFT